MKFMQINETAINLEHVVYVEKKEDDGTFKVEISFVTGALCVNVFESVEEQEELFDKIMSNIF
jgi:hypothetical protein